ncbi:hypothetical protein LQ327_04345 [Actinomycetospora endophytica]|uniref:Uncharacterized protein n=1 Tax=Actinomycetospora endophytica TaxID=2291215 RepID=A0ABS8P308_9PSEU|nr:hypothetical protein [Actinomycetospora endophytica]MCD2192618.1 hypothetical protein [Actinomycetospora endophytica]
MSADACTHAGWTTRQQARLREVTTVQLQPQHLRAGRLPVVAVGELLEVAPVLYLDEVEDLRCRPPVAWEAGPFGIVGACGVIGEPRILHEEDGAVGVHILQVGDREVVLNDAGLDEPVDLEPGRRVFVEGSFYLDVDLVEATERLSIPMRGRYRLAAVRRYRARLPEPPRTEPLRGIPAPDDVDDGVFLHVADLVGPVRTQPS